jgi:hypothetical protein
MFLLGEARHAVATVKRDGCSEGQGQGKRVLFHAANSTEARETIIDEAG